MKIEFKQSFEIEGKEFKIKKKDKVEVADVPAFFCFIAYFIALVKEQKVKVLEVNEAEFKDVDFEKYKISDEDEDFMQAHLEAVSIEDSEEGSDEESNSIPDSDLSVSDAEEVLTPSEEVKAEVAVEDAEAKPSKEEIEFNELHEKAKRLNKNERKRYEELKVKLGKEG